MQSRHHIVSRGLMASVMSLLIASGAYAQSNGVEFRLPNGDAGGTVKIANGQAVTFDETGNLNVVCAPDANDSAFCDGVVGKSTGVSGDAASVGSLNFSAGGTISNGGSTTTVGTTQGLTVTVRWQADTTVNVCQMTTTGDAASNPVWTNQVVDISGGTNHSQSFTLAASTSADLQYHFTLTCFNASGSDPVTGSKTITATVLEREQGTSSEYPGIPTDSCSIVKGVGLGADPLFKPAGYTAQMDSWSDAMFRGKTTSNYPDLMYPNMPSDQPALGSITLPDRSTMKNKYLSIAFGEHSHAVRYAINWISAFGYSVTPPYAVTPADNVFVTISDCAGDFRYTLSTKSAAERLQGDATFTKSCRKSATASSIYLNNDVNTTSHCTTTPGKRYYLNIIFADPTNGISPDPASGTPIENTCDAGRAGTSGKCEAQFSIG